MPEINSMEFLHLKVSRFLSAERVGGWESAFVGFLGNSRYCRSTRFLRRKAHRKFTWNIVCQVFAIFWGGCIFSGRGVHFLFLFFLKEKVSYIRYHEVFSGVSWLTSTHPAWVVSPPVSATKRFGKTCQVDSPFLNATWLQSCWMWFAWCPGWFWFCVSVCDFWNPFSLDTFCIVTTSWCQKRLILRWHSLQPFVWVITAFEILDASHALTSYVNEELLLSSARFRVLRRILTWTGAGHWQSDDHTSKGGWDHANCALGACGAGSVSLIYVLLCIYIYI